MGIPRIIYLAVLLWLAWWLYRRLIAPHLRQSRPEHGRGAQRQSPPSPRMLPCQVCGLHVPEEEVVRDSQGRVYCCEAHRIHDKQNK